MLLRFTSLFAVSAVLALSSCSSTSQECGQVNCGGCCTRDGECVGGTVDTECGAAGLLCDVCSGAQHCISKTCVVPQPMLDGGVDAGVDAGLPTVDAGTAIVAPEETWTWVDFPDSACGNGVPTGLGLNWTNRSRDVFIYLEGGGACWHGVSCFVARTAVRIETGYTATSFPSDGALSSPFFNRGNVSNPLKDMSFVYVPYCTGDVHAGDSVQAYDAQNPNRLVHHKGGKNMRAFLRRLAATFPDAERVFITGSSAGAYGAQLNFPKVKEAFPTAEIHVMADCGQMINPVAGRLDEWMAAWNVEVPPDCTGCIADFPKYPAYLAATYPQSRFALLAYEEDGVIRQFFGYDAATLKTNTLSLLADKYDGRSNAKYFLVPASDHVMMDDLFTQQGPGGVSLLTFTNQWLSGNAAWTNVKQ